MVKPVNLMLCMFSHNKKDLCKKRSSFKILKIKEKNGAEESHDCFSSRFIIISKMLTSTLVLILLSFIK